VASRAAPVHKAMISFPTRSPQPQSIKPVAVMSDVIDCFKIHYGMPSALDERIDI
jgi:hypothetical protein